MSKSIFFTGQPILNQLLKLIDRGQVKALARLGKHDYYYKHFDTYTHLVTMLYCTLNKCTSSREVVSGMKACSHKLRHLVLKRLRVKAPFVMATRIVQVISSNRFMSFYTCSTGTFYRTAEQ